MEMKKFMKNQAASPSQRQSGFTLIELMITVAIVAILAAIALPNYTEYVIRSHRADARAAVTNAVQYMERQYTVTNAYPATLPTGYNTEKYVISLSATTPTTYTLQAAPVSGWADTKCDVLSVSNVGLKTANGTKSSAFCWSS